MNITVCFFKEAIRIVERATTVTVDTAANEIGRNITPIISAKTSSDGAFSRNFSIDALFCNVIKSSHPAAISQNLVGIRKYAADWLIG